MGAFSRRRYIEAEIRAEMSGYIVRRVVRRRCIEEGIRAEMSGYIVR